MLQCSNDFGMMQVRPHFENFCTRSGILFCTYKKNLRILAGVTLVAKNQKRIFAMDGSAHTLESYIGMSAGSWKKPLRGNYEAISYQESKFAKLLEKMENSQF